MNNNPHSPGIAGKIRKQLEQGIVGPWAREMIDKLLEENERLEELNDVWETESWRANAEIESIRSQLAEAANILRDMDAHMDLSEPVPSGGSMGEFEDATGINQVFERATHFLSQYKEADTSEK